MKRILLVIIVVVVLFWGASFASPKNAPETSQSVGLGGQNLTLVIDFHERDDVTYSTNFSEHTAFSLLQEGASKSGIELDTTQYDFGILVNAIGESVNSEEMAWIYFVNNNSGNVAAEQKELAPGDLVEWRYIEPNY